MIETVALVVAAVALGIAAFALWVAWEARGHSRNALGTVAALASSRPPRRPAPEPDERQVNLGAPREVGERRQHDEGRAARHRAPDEQRARRGDADDPQWSTQAAATEQIPVAGRDPSTVEHPGPRRPGSGPDLRRPPPPLPPPGSITGSPR